MSERVRRRASNIGRGLTGVNFHRIRSDGSVVKSHVPRLDAPFQIIIARILRARMSGGEGRGAGSGKNWPAKPAG